jgi:hypothetical protein
MTIITSVTENRFDQQVIPVLITVLVVLVLYGMPSLVYAADLSVRIYERGGKSPIQDVSVCLGTPANISQFGTNLTGPDGTVTFRDIPRASLIVTASKSGYKAEQQSLITNNADRLLVMTLPTGGGGPICDAGSAHIFIGSGAIRVSQFEINKGAAVTAIPHVFLNHETDGIPTHYRASEHPDFIGADWQTYTAVPGFELSPGNGRKVVYFQMRRFSEMNGADLEVLSSVVQDSITLQRR